MKNLYILALLCCAAFAGYAQSFMPLDTNFTTKKVIVAKSPAKYQTLFIGGIDRVWDNTKATYARAKQWHDFIGVAPTTTTGQYWVIVNHESQIIDDTLGDGGGMTLFMVQRSADTLKVTTVNGHKFWNVNFRPVGGTLTNCGGIDFDPFTQKFWTAEEYGASSNTEVRKGRVPSEGAFDVTVQDFHLKYGSAGNVSNYNESLVNPSVIARYGTSLLGIKNFSDTEPYSNMIMFSSPGIGTKVFETLTTQGIDLGTTTGISSHLNYLWMVEIDPFTQSATRKMFNWGRFGHEGGAISADGKIVYLTDDNTPGVFYRFVTTTAGDYINGSLQFFKQGNSPQDNGSWMDIPKTWANVSNPTAYALANGAAMFIRKEWIDVDKETGKVYIAETGNDNPTNTLNLGMAAGGKVAHHLVNRFGLTVSGTSFTGSVFDYHGRVLEYDPATERITSYIEGGKSAKYPQKVLSSPDGLSVMNTTVNGMPKKYLVIQEDLNGVSQGRSGNSNSICEVYLYDMSLNTKSVDDLMRVAITPIGAEVTGARVTPDGKSLLINSQHASARNEAPFNNSLTFAINNMDQLLAELVKPYIYSNRSNVSMIYTVGQQGTNYITGENIMGAITATVTTPGFKIGTSMANTTTTTLTIAGSGAALYYKYEGSSIPPVSVSGMVRLSNGTTTSMVNVMPMGISPTANVIGVDNTLLGMALEKVVTVYGTNLAKPVFAQVSVNNGLLIATAPGATWGKSAYLPSNGGMLYLKNGSTVTGQLINAQILYYSKNENEPVVGTHFSFTNVTGFTSGVTTSPSPMIVVNPSNIPELNATISGDTLTYDYSSVTVSGMYLTDVITITANNGFGVLSSTSTFGEMITLPATGGVLKVALITTVTGVKSGTLYLKSGSTNVSMNLNGNVRTKVINAVSEHLLAFDFSVFPNPASRELRLNQVIDVAIYNYKGEKVKVSRNSDLVDIRDLVSGVYFIQSIKGDVVKLIIE